VPVRRTASADLTKVRKYISKDDSRKNKALAAIRMFAMIFNCRSRLEGGVHRACGYGPSDAAVGGHAPIRCRNATILPR